jgi:para-nitrobenzyl esterase
MTRIENHNLNAGSVSRRSMLKSSLLGGAAAAATGIIAPFGAAAAPQMRKPAMSTESVVGDTVETTAGKVRGITRAGVQIFRSIPYGATTAAPYRFMPPRKPEPWTGVRNAFLSGHMAQQIRPIAAAPAGVGDRANAIAGDDCLSLNVFTPSTRDHGKRPVMFWLHGGGFTIGSGMGLVYDGTNLARTQDVVLVAINHRLNVFGYMYLGHMGDERYADSGMVGILDIVQALEWVRDNIAQFGGDPNNVTIFGQSGGGGKTSTLLAMPAAKGLYHRAIVQSGSIIKGISVDDAQKTTDKVLGKLGITAGNLAKLQELPPRAILEAALSGGPDDLGRTMYHLGPVVDGRSLTRDPFDPDAPSVSADVPLMVGTVETESSYFAAPELLDMNDAQMHAALEKRFAGQTDRVIQTFRKTRPDASPSELYFIITSFPMNAIFQVERRAALHRAPVYMYLFKWRTPIEDGRRLTPHTVEMSFTYNNVWDVPEMVGTGPDLQPLADKVSSTWATFARTGNPHVQGLPEWPAYDTSTRATMFINSEFSLVNDPNRDERELLLSLPRQPMF